MLTRLSLERFKNFYDTTLELGPLTLLVGTNASGKSNLRDAFRFLHVVSRDRLDRRVEIKITLAFGDAALNLPF
jgi:AAA15 family ATPase/GTPase